MHLDPNMMMIAPIGDWAGGPLGAVMLLIAFFGPARGPVLSANNEWRSPESSVRLRAGRRRGRVLILQPIHELLDFAALAFGRKLKAAMVDVINNEKRPGGTLYTRASA